MLKIALSHDIDRIDKSYQIFTHSFKALKKAKIKRAFYHLSSNFRKNAYWGFDEIIKIETNYNVRSTNFFLNESIAFNPFVLSTYQLALGRYSIYDQRIKEIISFLDKNGWEVGLHGSYNSFENEALLKQEKQILEQILGHQIIGIRQHYLNLNDATWTYQYNCNLKYDSSFGYNNALGFKDKKVAPFKPLENDFIVFPQVIMDTPFVNNNKRWELLKEIFDEAEELNGVVVVNWHNNYFNESEFPEYKSTYIKIIEEGLKRNAAFKTLGMFYYENV